MIQTLTKNVHCTIIISNERIFLFVLGTIVAMNDNYKSDKLMDIQQPLVFFHVLQYPVKLLTVGNIAGPMFVDRSNEAFLLALQQVPHGIAGGGWTGVVVEAPGHIGLGLDVGGEAHHVVIG